jgi:hypothetical protein
MLIITEQKKIGEIFGHPVYQVTRTSMVELANSKTRSTFQNFKDENRFVWFHCSIKLPKVPKCITIFFINLKWLG